MSMNSAPVYEEVLFATLTLHNGTSKTKLFQKVEGFCAALSYHTKTHIRALRGYEVKTGNSHEHVLFQVPSDEKDRFLQRFQSFKPEKTWCIKFMNRKTGKTNTLPLHQRIEAFDHSRKEDAYRYALVKHQPVEPNESPEFYCPKHYSRCRKGNCSHIPEE